eukprot:TRINITY_DN2486_c0_g2_i1.p1 TRINITY_DN2486_c0_g2~~TRINITY_DN2486_c0_g2_i1.p1  ORF type:complete len:100 (-),score=10.50 TRINITY_DN2486_c0_g2_i1:182-481(-)
MRGSALCLGGSHAGLVFLCLFPFTTTLPCLTTLHPPVLQIKPKGGGIGGKKESGQLRFGGRERPFKKPIILPGHVTDDHREILKLRMPPTPHPIKEGKS